MAVSPKTVTDETVLVAAVLSGWHPLCTCTHVLSEIKRFARVVSMLHVAAGSLAKKVPSNAVAAERTLSRERGPVAAAAGGAACPAAVLPSLCAVSGALA
jgi:hypothetical protein